MQTSINAFYVITKLQYRRGSQTENSWKTAWMLEFVHFAKLSIISTEQGIQSDPNG